MDTLKKRNERPKGKCLRKLNIIIGTMIALFIMTGIFFAYRLLSGDEIMYEHYVYSENEINDITYPAADSETAEDYVRPENTLNEQSRNLQKLSKVWGFVKYTHLAFLTGERCWDEELLSLIPVVRFADPESVNDILYSWFTGLGNDGYDLDYPAFRSILLDDFQDHSALINYFFDDANNHNWASVEGFHKELWLLNIGFEMNLRPMANISWINEEYLDEALANALSRFNNIQVADRARAPVYFDEVGNSVFTNMERFIEIDYADSNHRILGLFRMWNAVKYYFPYLDIIDYDWSELLLEYIPIMLEGDDSFSYEVTLITLASRLQDAHINFYRGAVEMWLELLRQPSVEMDIIAGIFGSRIAPVPLREAEGYLVVSRNGHGLEAGDVILRINDTDIGEIVDTMLQYLPFPNDDKALAYLVRNRIVLRQHSGALPMAIDIYRLGEELRVYVNTSVTGSPHRYIWQYSANVYDSHQLLDNNIGLINPSLILREDFRHNAVLHGILEEFRDANINGLIIDLRQHPMGISNLLAEYLLAEQAHFVTMSRPLGAAPGVFIDNFQGVSGLGTSATNEDFFGSFFHDTNVVLLVNEHTQSHGEFTVMTLNTGGNVTVMGTNTIGANGNITFLPLPGGIVMAFTGLGVYEPDGGQTQRIGLSPDVYVPRTADGIKYGIDELMEAAVEFLMEQMIS